MDILAGTATAAFDSSRLLVSNEAKNLYCCLVGCWGLGAGNEI